VYSQKIIERSIAAYENATGTKLIRHEHSYVDSMIGHLNKLLGENGLVRQFTAEELAFVKNEQIMSKFDFLYWASRYGYFIGEGGVFQRFNPWESQSIVLRLIAKIEEEMYDRLDKGQPIDGILIDAHKARQLGLTQLAQLLIGHRTTTTDHIRGLLASVDDQKVFDLFQRFERIIDNLPYWMKPSKTYHEKGKHLYFDKLDTRIVVQDSRQMSGLGQGEQFEVSHLTEVASWENPLTIEHDFEPTLAQSIRTLSIRESTAQGRVGWWYDTITHHVNGGTSRWHLCFIPYYAEPTKYRRQPPDNWNPSNLSLQHAQKVYETSEKFVGKKIMLSKETLYWHETTRAQYQEKGILNLFLTNYASTPEESFQHTTQSAFDSDLLDYMRLGAASNPAAYEILTRESA
jgi:hypothetical protein